MKNIEIQKWRQGKGNIEKKNRGRDRGEREVGINGRRDEGDGGIDEREKGGIEEEGEGARSNDEMKRRISTLFYNVLQEPRKSCFRKI
jgi:hypothetical protein